MNLLMKRLLYFAIKLNSRDIIKCDCLWVPSYYLFASARKAVGNFRNDDGDGDGNQEVKKAMGLLRKTTTLHVHHAFLYISSPSLHDYDVKMPNCKFYAGRKQATTNLSL